MPSSQGYQNLISSPLDPDLVFSCSTRVDDFFIRKGESKSDEHDADISQWHVESMRKRWLAICPFLHVADQEYQSNQQKLLLDTVQSHPSMISKLILRMENDGYFQSPPPFADQGSPSASSSPSLDVSSMSAYTELIQNLRRGICTLLNYGYDPTFILVFDESWILCQLWGQIMEQVTGNCNNLDILAWYIDPNKDQAGFSPHRDRQPEDVPKTFKLIASAGKEFDNLEHNHSDYDKNLVHAPMYSTCWVALTDACPDNSCLYVLPRWADPGYYFGDDHTSDKDPLQTALNEKEKYQTIRCLPLASGHANLFSHRIIHWGSAGRKGYDTPRVSLAFACADDDYEPAYFDRATFLPFPPLPLRLSLIGGQMIVYHERFDFGSKEMSLFHKMFLSNKPLFHQSYRDKIAEEFLSCAKWISNGGWAEQKAQKTTNTGDETASHPSSRLPSNPAKRKPTAHSTSSILSLSDEKASKRHKIEDEEDEDDMELDNMWKQSLEAAKGQRASDLSALFSSNRGKGKISEDALPIQGAEMKSLSFNSDNGNLMDEDDSDAFMEEALEAVLQAEMNKDSRASFEDDFDLICE